MRNKARDILSTIFAIAFSATLIIHIAKHPGDTSPTGEPKPVIVLQEIKAQIPQPVHEACATQNPGVGDQRPEVRDQCTEDIREVVRAASKALDNIEEIAPELIALGQQFIRTLEGWAGSSTGKERERE